MRKESPTGSECVANVRWRWVVADTVGSGKCRPTDAGATCLHLLPQII